MAASGSFEEENTSGNEDGFKWLRRDMRGPTYTSYAQFANNPACSFEWGSEGCAGCSSNGGELLHLTAPSLLKGLVTVRGKFSTSMYSSLSRAQRDFGGPATFGLEISRADHEYKRLGTEKQRLGSSFHLGKPIDRGCFNYRWPVNEYFLNRGTYVPPAKETQESEQKHAGTCTMFSCSKGGVVYQVLRIDDGGHFDGSHRDGLPVGTDETDDPHDRCRHFPDESQVQLTMGGPVWFQSFDADRLFDHVVDRGTVTRRAPSGKKKEKREKEPVADWSIEAGAEDDAEKRVPIGPPDPNAGEPSPDTAYTTIRYYDTRRQVGLRAKVFHLNEDGSYEALPMWRSRTVADNGPPESRSGLSAYNVRVELPIRKGNTAHVDRSATFLAAISLFEADDKGNVEADPLPRAEDLPTSRELYEYVGVDPSHREATGALWDSVFLDLETQPDYVSELAEVNFVGRCLEKILQVDCVPAVLDDLNETPSEGSTPAGKEVVLLSNLFLRPNIDLKAVFWKVRFLVQAHKFLSELVAHHTRNKQAAPANDSWRQINPRTDIPNMRTVAAHQLNRIRQHVKGVVRYLVKALLGPDTAESPLLPDYHIAGESNYYYVTTTVWYVVKNFPDWSWDDCKRALHGHGELSARLLADNRMPPEHWTFEAVDREKVDLLRWFHCGSVFMLCREGFLPDTWLPATRKLATHKERMVELGEKVARLAKAAKITSAAKRSRRLPYVAEDEIFDRLSLMSDELGLEVLDPGTIGKVVESSITRVKNRDFTRVVNPGWLPPLVEGSKSGPWEIHALCHHSRLAVYCLEPEEARDWRTKEHLAEEVASYKRKLHRFLNAEGTLIPSWERAHTLARRGFLRSEATAVVATTILALRSKAIPEPAGNTPDGQRRGSSGGLVLEAGNDSHQAGLGERKLIQEIVFVESLLKEQLSVLEKFTGEASQNPPIRWMTFAPLRFYHPEGFVNSLEDTPELYEKLTVTGVSDSDPSMTEVCGLKDREGTFKYGDLASEEILTRVFVSDIRATESRMSLEVFAEPVHIKYRADLRGSTDPKNQEKLQASQEKFCWALYDSLVDQEVQHRFFSVRNLSHSHMPSKLVELYKYVIHPEATPCLDNHHLRFTRFFCNKQDTWVAGITLRSWQVVRKAPNSATTLPGPSGPPSGPKTSVSSNTAESSSGESFQSHFPDDRPVKPPDDWEDRLGEVSHFELEVSSIVISTNTFGDFSKCTILSELIQQEDMERLVDDARMLWQKFMHQPQTGRCLIVFLVLGRICHIIAENYDQSLHALVPIMGLENSSKRTNAEWKERDKTLDDFGLELWGLESLYKMQTSLKASVLSVLEAKAELTLQINDGPGKRSPILERMCQEYLGIFETSVVQLAAVSTRLERRIELYTRERESFAAVLEMKHSFSSLRQSDLSHQLSSYSVDQNDIVLEQTDNALRQTQVSLYQNSAIQRLTYLTIGYLPLGLMSAIFAIPDNQEVDIIGMGLKWFVGGILILSLATFILAAYVGSILDFLAWPPPRPRVRFDGSESDKPPPNIWRILFRKHVAGLPVPMTPSDRLQKLRTKYRDIRRDV